MSAQRMPGPLDPYGPARVLATAVLFWLGSASVSLGATPGGNAGKEPSTLSSFRFNGASETAPRTDLVSRFTDGTTQGWRPVEDVTLSVVDMGQPSFSLRGTDWGDGRYFKVASPVAWAGDWRVFRRLSFDMHWTGRAAAHPRVELVRIIGANGLNFSWYGAVAAGVWTHRSIPLTGEMFGVSDEMFDETMRHVTEMWLFGEFDTVRDVVHFDNIVLSMDPGAPPTAFTEALASSFDEDAEGWVGYDNSLFSWSASNGFRGGALRSVDGGVGTARFQSPDAWMGDWRAFKWLRFKLRIAANRRADFVGRIEIVGRNGKKLIHELPRIWPSWTPVTVELKPQVFGVELDDFEGVLEDVACLWINADLISGSGVSDTTYLDDVTLMPDDSTVEAADRWSDFEAGREHWRYGGWDNSAQIWTFSGFAPHYASGGNPGGNLQNTDTAAWTYWFTPESWAGDWRGLSSVSFDFKIIQGTAGAMFERRMISLCTTWTNMHADVSRLPVMGQWQRFEFPLTAATFGVSEETFHRAIRDVVFLGIRSEWFDRGAEREALDNVRVSSVPDAYWTNGVRYSNSRHGNKRVGL